MSKKELEKIQKAERKAQREQDRALIQQQKANFEHDMIQMDKDKVSRLTRHPHTSDAPNHLFLFD